MCMHVTYMHIYIDVCISIWRGHDPGGECQLSLSAAIYFLKLYIWR